MWHEESKSYTVLETWTGENILELLPSKAQLKDEEISEKKWDKKESVFLFVCLFHFLNLMGYKMTCSNIGKKDLVDRKIKVEVSGKGREIWRVKKEWHGIRVQEKDKTLQGGWEEAASCGAPP